MQKLLQFLYRFTLQARGANVLEALHSELGPTLAYGLRGDQSDRCSQMVKSGCIQGLRCQVAPDTGGAYILLFSLAGER